MTPTRRDVLAAGLASVAAPGVALAEGQGRFEVPIGVVIHSFPVHMTGDRERHPTRRFAEPMAFLEYARSLGFRGIQVAIGVQDDTYAIALRTRAEDASMNLEGIVAPPRDQADLARFEAEIRTARLAKATVVRTVLLSGRRYEAFDSLDGFRQFAERSAASLALAAPVVARHGVRLALENHKDRRLEEMVALLKKFGSDHIGACVDVGNNMALLEDPVEVVEALAPWAFTTHLKDMGVAEADRGFLLAEVPLGKGVLDLPRIVKTLRAARPDVPLQLEMITRDPLEIPCLTDRYWATFPDLPARQLARVLAFIRSHRPERPLPWISGLTPAERLRVEDDNIRLCLAYARDHL